MLRPADSGQEKDLVSPSVPTVSVPKGEDAAQCYDKGTRGDHPGFGFSAPSILSEAGFDRLALSQQIVGCCDRLLVQLSD